MERTAEQVEAYLGFRKGEPVEWDVMFLKVTRRGLFQRVSPVRKWMAEVLSENGLVETPVGCLRRTPEWYEIKDGWGTVPMA